MKKFIYITFIFIVIIVIAVIATFIAMLLGLVLDEQQKIALIVFCVGGLSLAVYRAIWEC